MFAFPYVDFEQPGSSWNTGHPDLTGKIMWNGFSKMVLQDPASSPELEESALNQGKRSLIEVCKERSKNKYLALAVNQAFTYGKKLN